MTRSIITLPSMTFAQKAKATLSASEVEAIVLKLPPQLSDKGCAWGIAVNTALEDKALHILRVADLPFKKVWRQEV